MICVIRIRGQVGLRKEVIETLDRLRLRKKYSCVVLNPKKEQLGMIKKMKDHVAYGEISDDMFEKLIEARGKQLDKSKKINAKKIVEELKSGKNYEDANLKPFFRLHPPRKGIKTKVHFPKGALGNHGEKINSLIERML
jgi:large subunit ribosomal protein L30